MGWLQMLLLLLFADGEREGAHGVSLGRGDAADIAWRGRRPSITAWI